MQTIYQILSNPIYSAILAAAISFAISLFFYKRSKERGSIVYSVSSRAIIGNNVSFTEGLRMEFKHKEIDQLHVSDVTFRSKSSDSLRRSDLNELDPFGIKIDRHPSYNGRYRAVCDVEVKSTTSKASNIKVGSIEGNFDNFIPILFDHLDKNDGAKIRIHHTGSERIEICGKVVGISKIVRRLW